ncbi:LPS export ABC transporter permease LptG [Endothiovibrio diazotrophicus]
MKVLDRYVGRVLLRATLTVLAVLVSIELFFGFLGELPDVGKGDYTTAEAALYILLTIPRRIHEVIGYSALIGALFALGALAAHAELTAIRAAGVSLQRLVGSVLKSGAVIMLGATLVGEVVAPPVDQYALNRRAVAQSQNAIFRSANGFWVRDGNDFINIRDIFPGGRLGGIYIYEFDGERRLRKATAARGAVYQKQGWLLEGIEQSVIDEKKVTVSSLPRAPWDSLLSPELINVVTIAPERLSAWGLARYIAYLLDNGLDAVRYEHAFWGRVSVPFTGLVMLVLAVPFSFGRMRSAAIGLRFTVGALLGIGFHLFNQTIGHLGQIYGLNAAFTAFAPSLLFLGLAMVMLRRVR